MLSFYIKSAIRNITRKRFFSLLNISGLAIGICVFFLSLEFYTYEKGFNRFHPNLSRLYRVNIATNNGNSATTFPAIAPLMQQSIPGVHRAVRFADNFNDGAVVSYQSSQNSIPVRSFREEGCVFVDASFLEAFHFPLIAGQNELDKTNTVVITSTGAQKLFGREDAIGKTLHLHNQFGDLPVRVVGVIADIPAQSDIRFNYLFSIEILNNPGYTVGSEWARLDSWGNDSYTSYVWLDNNTDPTAVAKTASVLWQQKDPDYKKDNGAIILQPVSEMHLGNSIKDANPTYSSLAMTWFILGLGILVLCIAWINYVNFSTADALSRAKEIGIHKIIGSRRRQIIIRYIMESLILNVLGLAIAFGLTNLVQDLFNYITGKTLSLHYIDHPATWIFVAGIFFAGIIFCGGYVGAILSRFKPIAILQFNATGGIGNMLARKGLIVFQLTISCIFILSTLVAYRQIRFMKQHDLGMNIDHLVVIEGAAIRDSSFKAHSAIFTNQLAGLPFVQQLSCTGSVPGIGSGHNYNSDGITGASPRKGDEHTNYYISEVDEHYFDTYQIPFLDGRNFSKDAADKGYKGDALIVNEPAAKALGYDPATAAGRTVNWNRPYTIAAVVKDYHHRSLKEKIEPILYVPQHNNHCYTIKLSDKELPERMATIKSLYEKLYPGNPFEYTVLKEAYDDSYAEEQRAGTIALSLAVLVIVIAGLGLIGLSTFAARRRTKEMSIRKVLGASVLSLFTHLSKEFLWLVVIAFIIATPVAWYALHKWLESFAYRIPISWWLFPLTGLLCLFITLLTVSFQAARAALVNPSHSLRSE